MNCFVCTGASLVSWQVSEVLEREVEARPPQSVSSDLFMFTHQLSVMTSKAGKAACWKEDSRKCYVNIRSTCFSISITINAAHSSFSFTLKNAFWKSRLAQYSVWSGNVFCTVTAGMADRDRLCPGHQPHMWWGLQQLCRSKGQMFPLLFRLYIWAGSGGEH